MYPLLAEFGHLEDKLQIIQVAGTNGKGSVSYLTAGLLSAVTREPVGLYTSPHLEKLNERFQIVDDQGRRPFPFEQVELALARVAEATKNLPSSLGPVTEFEAWTVAAVLLFYEAGLTNAVFEVGLGGRLDATTALPAKLAVICPIDYDHLDRLGTDLASIAAEKAAIIRPGQPVVVAEQQAAATAVIEAVALEQRARLIPVAERYQILEFTSAGTDFTWLAGNDQQYTFRLGLKGRQQVMNAACALSAVEEYVGSGQLAQAQTRERIARFLAEAKWPGRFELLESHGQQVLLDVGHNPQAIKVLLENLQLYFPDTPIWGVYGSLLDKDYRTVAALLTEYPFQGLVITEPWSERKLSSRELAALFPPSMQIIEEADLESAVELGLAKAKADRALVAIFGSFFLVGPARTKLMQSVEK